MQHGLLPCVSKAVKNTPRLFPVEVGGGGKSIPFVCLNACFPHGRWWLGIRMSSISELGVNNTRGKLSSAMKISTKLSLRSPNLLHLRSVFYFWWSLGRISLDCHLQLYVSEIIFIFCSCSVYKDQANVRSAVVNSTASQPPMWGVTNSMIPCSVAPLKESHALFSLTWALETGFCIQTMEMDLSPASRCLLASCQYPELYHSLYCLYDKIKSGPLSNYSISLLSISLSYATIAIIKMCLVPLTALLSINRHFCISLPTTWGCLVQEHSLPCGFLRVIVRTTSFNILPSLGW